MKKTKRILLALVLVTLGLLTLNTFAQEAELGGLMPKELESTNFKDWQLNGVTITFLVMVLGRVFQSLRSGGGLVGLYRGLVYGTNTATPKQEAQKATVDV